MPDQSQQSSPATSASTSAPKGRNTRQKAAILSLLQQTPDFVTAQELHANLKESGARVSLATVYRVLQNQVEQGVVDVLPQDDGESLFRQCATTKHHHHLVCTRCGAAVEVEAPAVEQWASRVAEDNGFTSVTHTLEIYGLCPQCTTEVAESEEEK